jgi:hypothetical protein
MTIKQCKTNILSICITKNIMFENAHLKEILNELKIEILHMVDLLRNYSCLVKGKHIDNINGGI